MEFSPVFELDPRGHAPREAPGRPRYGGRPFASFTSRAACRSPVPLTLGASSEAFAHAPLRGIEEPRRATAEEEFATAAGCATSA